MACEEERNSEYKPRLENNRTYKEKLKIEEAVEGMNIDVKDTEGIWCAGIVKTVLKNEKKTVLYVHYDRWDDFFDELISVESGRLAPSGTYTQRNILRYKLALSEGNRQGEIIK